MSVRQAVGIGIRGPLDIVRIGGLPRRGSASHQLSGHRHGRGRRRRQRRARSDVQIYPMSAPNPAAGPLWVEMHEDVQITGGLFNVVLGTITAFPDYLFSPGSDRWLSIAVDLDPEMSPWTRITSVPWAFKAAIADSALNSGGAPSGWTAFGTVLLRRCRRREIGIIPRSRSSMSRARRWALPGGGLLQRGSRPRRRRRRPRTIQHERRRLRIGDHPWRNRRGRAHQQIGDLRTTGASFAPHLLVRRRPELRGQRRDPQHAEHGRRHRHNGSRPQARDKRRPEPTRGSRRRATLGSVLELKTTSTAAGTWNGRINFINSSDAVEGSILYYPIAFMDQPGMIFTAGGYTRLFFNRLDRELGVGTTTPAEKLDVAGAVRATVLKLTGGSDIAEPFDVTSPGDIMDGMVLVIDPESPGNLKIADRAYDRCVAGIISGAGESSRRS